MEHFEEMGKNSRSNRAEGELGINERVWLGLGLEQREPRLVLARLRCVECCLCLALSLGFGVICVSCENPLKRDATSVVGVIGGVGLAVDVSEDRKPAMVGVELPEP